MSASIFDGDDFLRMLMSQSGAEQGSAAPLGPPVSRDKRGIDTLIRLIVRDELQRHMQAQSSDSLERGRVADDDADTLTPVGAAIDNAATGDPDAEVMSAEDVAAFLGVDRNTVYDYAGRGTIPCRRLGKRLLFHRPVLVAWLDPCKAASARKA